MNIKDFVAKMKANKYSKDYILEMEDKKICFSFYEEGFFDVTDYENDEKSITHASLERHINKKVDVINFIRDSREDCWDDGGYCFYVGKYNGKFILGSNYISYNLDFSHEFIEEPQLEDGDLNIEYKLFDTIEEISLFIEQMLSKAKELTEECEDWYSDFEYLDEEYLKNDDLEDKFLYHCLRNLGSAFNENIEKESERLKSLTTFTGYVPRLIDPIEYYDNWIEENDVKALNIEEL